MLCNLSRVLGVLKKTQRTQIQKAFSTALKKLEGMQIRALIFLAFLVAAAHAFSPAAIHLAPRAASASAFTASHRPSPILGSRHVSNAGFLHGRDRATGLRMAVSLPADKPLKVGICGEKPFSLLCC
jgi:hypothetical protein